MTWGIVASVGGAVVGGLMSSDASRSAANTQADAARQASDAQLQATRESNQLQWQMYQQNLTNQSPFLQGGQTAYAALLGGMGLGAPGQNTPGYQAMPGQGGGVGAQYLDSSGKAYSGPVTTNAQGQNVDAQGNPVTAAPQLQNYGATPEQMAGAAKQFAGPGGTGQFTQTFKPSDLTTDPSYQWRLDQGARMIKNSQSGKGLLGSSQSQIDLMNYGQGAASQEYQNAYNRFMQNQETAYGRLAGLAGIGTNTAGNIGAAGQAAGQGIGSTTMAGVGASNQALLGGAQAQASGAIGQANAWGGAMQGGMNNWMTLQYLNKLQPNQPAGSAGGFYPDTNATNAGSLYGPPVGP